MAKGGPAVADYPTADCTRASTRTQPYSAARLTGAAAAGCGLNSESVKLLRRHLTTGEFDSPQNTTCGHHTSVSSPT
eukprot:6573419-Pyramimonas_sp.AAC.2